MIFQIKKKLQDCEISNLLIDAFLKYFITLENNWYELFLLYFFSKFGLYLNFY